jgi:hypothetical protein
LYHGAQLLPTFSAVLKLKHELLYEEEERAQINRRKEEEQNLLWISIDGVSVKFRLNLVQIKAKKTGKKQ